MAIGHCQRGGAIPWLHNACHIFVHRLVVGRQVWVGLPCLWDEHQLCRGRFLARTDQRFEHGVECTRVRGAGRDYRFDIVRMIAERDRGHLDLVALHPVLVAADRVDLAIVRKRAERLRQPPLRKCVGRITLVKDCHAAFEPLILQVGVKDRQALGEEQALVDDRPAREAANIEIADLGGHDLFLDPAADEVEILFELGSVHIFGHWPGDHDLLDLGPGALCLVANHRYVDGNLPPTIDGIASLNDFGLDNGAARFLRAKVGTRQKHHTHR